MDENGAEMAAVGTLNVSHRQERTNLLATDLAHEELDEQPLEVLILMGPWKQLHPDQPYRPQPPKQV